ncbi:myosin heavy chain, non-muscle [Leptidea sinapis]|uniref:myosin heavy chain, non-muscle n=1 Tax=Leptidea sinapis TaxID=189913 RepID=UPI00212E764D|nr:myosin heavy chain, non-muscle [Leptidea sinapis]
MGNLLSSASIRDSSASSDIVSSDSDTMENSNDTSSNDLASEEFHDTVDDNDDEYNKARAKIREKEMSDFNAQLSIQREKRKEILEYHRSQKKSLENALNEERKLKLDVCEENNLLRELLAANNIELPSAIAENKNDSSVKDAVLKLTEEIESLKSNNNKLRCDLASSNNTLQAAYSEMNSLSAQNSESMNQIRALKEVVSVSKTMISLREEQLIELKTKLAEIEQSLADRETSILSANLRQEYERQLQNIRSLRVLYEERARLAEVTRQALVKDLEEQKELYEAEVVKCNNLTDQVNELKAQINLLEDKIEDKNEEISACQEEMSITKAEMAVINKLFSQVLLGYKTKKDLDQLIQRLEENHGILTHMAENENESEAASALPKLLLDIVNQFYNGNIKDEEENIEQNTEDEQIDKNRSNSSAEEIVHNLPKVWKVLTELLSHQSDSTPNDSEKVTTCYKSVETSSGPVLVPSVSQTYIRLKDLIVEKLSLVKEVNRMKQLNAHLETRIQEQEKSLCLVTTELSKTWHVVARLRRHHHQLHTHEKILKYELQQKRKLLTEIKEELEYCKEKWEQAREKNTQTERDWRKLRTEFSNRKIKDLSILNNSAESGYSDERPSDESSQSNDESEYVTDNKIRCKKKLKKSFETVVDSSTDVNLAAEREDPVSDMLDVADLSLDTQDENQEILDVSDCCNTESMLRSDKILNDETEDEAADIANDSCAEELSIAELRQEDSIIQKGDSTENSIKTENNNSSYDESIPSSSKALEMQNFVSLKLDQYNNSKQNEPLQAEALALSQLRSSDDENPNITLETNTRIQLIDAEISVDDDKAHSTNNEISSKEFPDHARNHCNFEENNSHDNTTNGSTDEIKNENFQPTPSCSTNVRSTSHSEIDLKAILQNIKRQDEHLKQKDMRLDNLEKGSSSVVANIKNILKNSDAILTKIENLQENSRKSDTKEEKLEENQQSEPSKSNEINHEARFAARDIRLKRLEEQTKSLVNKVNDTTTKAVKINYKLEELHNIYGSDHSRAGTPSEDNADGPDQDDNTK